MRKKEEKAKQYAKNCYPYNEEMRLQCESHFESGWYESLKDILVDANKELPRYEDDVWVINEEGEKFFCHRSNNPDVVVDKYGWCNYTGSDIVSWIRNVTFDEILAMNKDILKRLKNK